MSIPFVTQLTNGATTDIVGNYATAETFELAGPAGDAAMVVARILVYVQDTGAFDAEKYGNNITLTNGIDLSIRDSEDALVVQLTPEPIISSGDWAALAHDVTNATFGTGDQYLTCRWTFAKFAGGGGLVLNRGQKLVATVEDNFTGLVHHKITAQGTIPGDY